MLIRRNSTRAAWLLWLALAGAPDARAIVGPAADATAYADRVVMVLARGGEGSGFCTGVVAAPRVILTAAHCLRGAADMAVFYRDAAGQPVLVAATATAAHPLYRANAIQRRVVSIDVGLVEIATPLPAAFRAADLAEGEGPAVGDAATAVGFGLGREGEPKSGGALRAAALRVRAPLSTVLLWAADPDGAGVGACSGDSGGPIFAADGRTVVAVVAWTSGTSGHKCGALTQGPLIAPLRGWIASVVARWGP
jgi:S1-C subfamily serine protease